MKDRLYWMADTKAPHNYKNSFFFNIDNDLKYLPFNNDFGPLNLAMVHRYCRELARLMKDPNYENCKIFHYVNSDRADTLVNGAFLMGCFQVVVMKYRTVEEAFQRFESYLPLFRHYRDASKGHCYYDSPSKIAGRVLTLHAPKAGMSSEISRSRHTRI